MTRLTQKAFGKHIGITQQGVARLVAHDLVDLSKGIDQARLDYCAHLREVSALHISNDGELDIVREKALLTKAERKLKEKKLAEQEDRLVDADYIKKSTYRAAVMVRDTMVGLPSRVMPSLIGMELRDATYRLESEIKQALTDAGALIASEEDRGP